MKGILFKTEMVQAILAGRKAQTRRVIKPQPDEDGLARFIKSGEWHDTSARVYTPKYQVGDILYVRETWAQDIDKNGKFFYRADYPDLKVPGGWRPALFMPKAAARIFLEVTAVRAERLQDITEADAIAEGVEMEFENAVVGGTFYQGKYFKNYGTAGYSFLRPIESFRALWDSINAKKHPWEKNNWVWVYKFKRIEKP